MANTKRRQKKNNRKVDKGKKEKELRINDKNNRKHIKEEHICISSSSAVVTAIIACSLVLKYFREKLCFLMVFSYCVYYPMGTSQTTF